MTEHKFAELKEGERWGELIPRPGIGVRNNQFAQGIIPLFFGDTPVQHILGQQRIKIYVVHKLNRQDFERQTAAFYLCLEMAERLDGMKEQLDKINGLYNELIFQVGNKYEGETRHETAKRYIRQFEDSIPQGPVSVKGTNND